MSRPQGTFPVELGESFRDRRAAYHTLRFNFKPQHVSWSRTGRLRVKDHRAVELRVDGAEDGDDTTIFHGHVEEQKPTDCMLICGLDGKWRLERLTSSFKNLPADRSLGRATAGAGGAAAGSSRAHEPVHAPHAQAQAQPPRAANASTAAADDVDEEQLFGGDEDEADEPASAAASAPALGIQLQEAPAHAGGGDLSDSVSDSVSDSGD